MSVRSWRSGFSSWIEQGLAFPSTRGPDLDFNRFEQNRFYPRVRNWRANGSIDCNRSVRAKFKSGGPDYNRLVGPTGFEPVATRL
jgi:hypothetical protein